MVLDVEAARQRVKGRIHETPLLSSSKLDLLAGTHVVFKCEHLQKTGSFKVRGATNAIVKIAEKGDAQGVIAFSTGNHGLAVCYAAGQVGLPATIVVPENIPAARQESLKAYGAQLEFGESRIPALLALSKRLAEERNLEDVVPFNNDDVISGQATLAAEILEKAPDVEAIFVSVGGGGLASGISHYVQQHRPDVEVYVVEPQGKDLALQLSGGDAPNREKDTLETVADALRARFIGDKCLEIMRGHVKVVSVTDEEILEAQRKVWVYLKQVVEPAGAVAFAGLLKSKPKHSKVAVILCGGNIEIESFFVKK